MSLDLTSELVLERPPASVSGYACNPENATSWHASVKSVEWKSAPVVHVGSRVALEVDFLGQHLHYTYEIVECVPGEKLVMRSVDGPIPLETSYTFEETRDGHTRMTFRNRGEPSGMSKLLTPVMVAAMKAANERDLLKLKEILEGH